MKRKLISLLLSGMLMASFPAAVFGAEATGISASAAQQNASVSPIHDMNYEKAALSIGGSQITKGKGFLNNVICLTEEDMESIYKNNSGESTYRLGLGDSFTERMVRYSGYENHGAPEWIYRSVAGIDIRTAAEALGIDTKQKLSVAVTSSDGFSKTLTDAFGSETKRYCFDPKGNREAEVMPMLMMYDTSVTSKEKPAFGSKVNFPPSPVMGADSKDRTSLTFGFGQTSYDEITSCYWVKDVNRLRIGPEDVAVSVKTEEGKTLTGSVSFIASAGVYRTSFSYGERVINATGIPLTELIRHLGAKIPDGGNLIVSNQEGKILRIPAEEADQWFAAWDASEKGAGVKNKTAVRLYSSGGEFADVTAVELSKEAVTSDQRAEQMKVTLSELAKEMGAVLERTLQK